MKKILLIATAALFAWTASAQDNNYRNTRDNNRNAAQAGNYRSTPENYRSAVGPRVNFYTNTGDASVGIGAYYRYSFDSHWRIEPSIYVLTEKDSSVDINFDAHYVFRIADWWGVYPQVGVVANDIKDWVRLQRRAPLEYLRRSEIRTHVRQRPQQSARGLRRRSIQVLTEAVPDADRLA